MKKVVVISGVTGFLGSHIANFITNDYQVYGLIRNKSNLWRLNEIKNSLIKLINIEDNNFVEKIKELKPYCFIHSAWTGVAANDRNTWVEQGKNFDYSIHLLNILKESGVEKFISLGSQAEYGYFETIIDENKKCNPFSAYGATKLATFNYTKAYCNNHNINWFWLRLFPLFGIREDENWFIPMLINKALKKQTIDLTLCEQEYAYLHISDFVMAIKLIVDSVKIPSDVFNLSNNTAIKIKEIIDLIKITIPKSDVFNIGSLPYRDNQVMLMQGDSNKFYSTFSFKPTANFESSIKELINYYKAK